MKNAFLVATLLAIACLTGACERQDYKDTRQFTHHGEHAAAHGSAAAPGHDGAAAPAGHDEKKPAADPK